MVFPLWAVALIYVAITAVTFLLRPRPPRRAIEKFQRPRVEEGETIPVGFGCFDLAPNIVWFGDQKEVLEQDDTVTKYYAKMLGMLCHGPIDAWLELRWNDKSTRLARSRDGYQNGTLLAEFPYRGITSQPWPLVRNPGTNLHAEQWIGLPGLFGGGLSQGGVAGMMHLHWGVLDDVVCELTKEAYGEDYASRFPGIAYATFGWRRLRDVVPGTEYTAGLWYIYTEDVQTDCTIGQTASTCIPTGVPGNVPCWFETPPPPGVNWNGQGVVAGIVNGMGLGDGGGAFWAECSITGLETTATYILECDVQASQYSGIVNGSSTTFVGAWLGQTTGASGRSEGGGAAELISGDQLVSGERYTVRSEAVPGGDGTLVAKFGCWAIEYGDGVVPTRFSNMRFYKKVGTGGSGPESYPQHTPYFGDAANFIASLLGGGAVAQVGPANHRFYFGANNPQPQPPVFLLQRIPVGLTHRQIGSHANPVACIYEILTNAQWGLGFDESLIDKLGTFEDAAERLQDEQFGISFLMDDPKEAEDWIDEILGVIDGVIWTDIRTGLLKIKLVRNDYVPASLPLLDESDVRDVSVTQMEVADLTAEVKVRYREFYDGEEGIKVGVQLTPSLKLFVSTYAWLKIPGTNLQSVTLKQGATTWVEGTDYRINLGTGLVLVLGAGANVTEGDPVTADYTAYPRFVGFREASATAQNLATWMATGDLKSEMIEYGMVPSEPLGRFVAQRSLRASSRRLRQARFKCSRAAFTLHPGAVFRFTSARNDVNDEVFRVTSVDFGTLEAPEMEVEALEDVFALSGIVVYDPETSPNDAPPPPSQLAPPGGWSLADPSRVYGWHVEGFPVRVRVTSDAAGGTTVSTATIVPPATYVDLGLTLGVTRWLWISAYDPAGVYEDSVELGPFELTPVSGTPGARPAFVAPTGTVALTFNAVAQLTRATLTVTDSQRHAFLLETRELRDGEWGPWRPATFLSGVPGLDTTLVSEEWIPLNANGTFGTVEWRVSYATELGDIETLTFRTSSDSQKPVNLAVGIGSGSSVIAVGVAGTAKVDFPFQLVGISMIGPREAGSAVLDIWIRQRSLSGVPTVADTIFSGTKPTLSSAQEYDDTSLGSVPVRAFGQNGPVDVVFNVDSITAFTMLGVTLKLVRLD